MPRTSASRTSRKPGRPRAPAGRKASGKNPSRRRTAQVTAEIKANPKAAADKMKRPDHRIPDEGAATWIGPGGKLPDGCKPDPSNPNLVIAPNGQKLFAVGNQSPHHAEARSVKEVEDHLYGALVHINLDNRYTGGQNISVFMPVAEAAFARMAMLANSKNEEIAYKAAKYLLDRRFGRPTERVAIESDGPSAVDRLLDRIANEPEYRSMVAKSSRINRPDPPSPLEDKVREHLARKAG